MVFRFCPTSSLSSSLKLLWLESRGELSFVVPRRVCRHYILGPKAGKTEVFAANLPGLPDNVRLATDGTLWVGTAGIRHADAPSLLDTFAAYPAARQFAIDVSD